MTRYFGEGVVGVSPLFFAAVMFSAWRWGLAAGITATALAGLATAYFFIEPVHSLKMGVDDVVRFAVFMAVAVLISYLHWTTKRLAAREAQASQAKDDFLALLGHELRNPLAPVLACASLMERDERLPEDVRQDAAMVRRHVELEARLIEDLLDLSRIGRGKLLMKLERVEVYEVIDDALRICLPQIDAKGLKVTVHLDAARHTVNGDPVRLRQLFWNLLNNAAKFTPPGGSVIISAADIHGGVLEVEVSDTGIGIEASVMPRIFDPFEQGGDAATREFGGLGLGLAICKAVVKAHGGSIRASSGGRGKGAAFRVRLPAAEHALSQRAAAASHAGPLRTATRRLSILLVEDQEQTRRLTSRLLRASGHFVEATSGVAEALAAADRLRFDLLVADIQLHDGTGLDLMRRVRERHGLPGIAVSGHCAAADLALSREAGFARHLVKPVETELLLAAVDEVGAGREGCGEGA